VKKIKKSIRHPTRKKHQNPTPIHTPISLGKQERSLLRYLYKYNNSRFNLKEYSRDTNTSRSTIYGYLDRLKSNGLVKRETANNSITKKGIILLTSSEKEEKGGVESSRRGCRKSENLSTHYHKFKLPISDKSKFSIEKLKRLNPTKYHQNKLHNLHQIIISFEDATVFINPKQLIINLYDVISANVEDSDIECISRAVGYAEKFMEIGVITEGMMIEEGHWARAESLLSNFLYKNVDKRYFLELKDGKKFWIDHSLTIEDETNDKQIRERTDKFLTEIATKDISLLDIDKITKALGFISKIESSRLLKEIDNRKRPKEQKPLGKASYIG